MTPESEITLLLDRLARVHSARRRAEGLTDAQSAALDYLSRANRFSRSPSVVADYLATTRGTASQTLKVLAEKGLIAEAALVGDKRQRRYDLTDRGQSVVKAFSGWIATGPDHQVVLEAARTVLRAVMSGDAGPTFGLCRRCRHHESRGIQPPYCRLIKIGLSLEEPDQLCHEFGEAV